MSNVIMWNLITLFICLLRLYLNLHKKNMHSIFLKEIITQMLA